MALGDKPPTYGSGKWLPSWRLVTSGMNFSGIIVPETQSIKTLFSLFSIFKSPNYMMEENHITHRDNKYNIPVEIGFVCINNLVHLRKISQIKTSYFIPKKGDSNMISYKQAAT
jgi:hypothetical protein